MSKHPRTDEYRAAFDLPRDEMACWAETLEAELDAVWRAMRNACEFHCGSECDNGADNGKCAERWQDCPAVKEASK